MVNWVYIFWNDLYISKFKYATQEGLYLCGKNFVEKNLRQNKSIKFQVMIFKEFLEIMYNRKKNKQGIRRTDHQIVLQSVLALIVLKQYDIDDLLYFPPKYKKSIKSNTKLSLQNR